VRRILLLAVFLIGGVWYVKVHPTVPPDNRALNAASSPVTPSGGQNSSGIQDRSPAAWLAIQRIIAQARSNPAAFREQYGAAAKALRGQQ
jgi:hypothetical protein